MTNLNFRKSLRLREYDYRQPGNYFFTICTVNRKCILGSVRGTVVHLSDLGELVLDAWLDIPVHHPKVVIDEMVIMPNHVHGIVCVGTDEHGMAHTRADDTSELDLSTETRGTRRARGSQKGSLGAIIGSFKSASSRSVNKYRGTPGIAIWQHNYNEHIIRDELSLDRIRAYIAGNPARWEFDEENPYRNRR